MHDAGIYCSAGKTPIRVCESRVVSRARAFVLERLTRQTLRVFLVSARTALIHVGEAAPAKVESASNVETDRGAPIDFCRDSPASVRAEARQAVWRWRWRNVEEKIPVLRSGMGGYGAHFNPLFHLLQTRPTAVWGAVSWGYQIEPNDQHFEDEHHLFRAEALRVPYNGLSISIAVAG